MMADSATNVTPTRRPVRAPGQNRTRPSHTIGGCFSARVTMNRIGAIQTISFATVQYATVPPDERSLMEVRSCRYQAPTHVAIRIP